MADIRPTTLPFLLVSLGFLALCGTLFGLAIGDDGLMHAGLVALAVFFVVCNVWALRRGRVVSFSLFRPRGVRLVGYRNEPVYFVLSIVLWCVFGAVLIAALIQREPL